MQKIICALIIFILIPSVSAMFGIKDVSIDERYYEDESSFYPKYEWVSEITYKTFSEENSRLLYEKIKSEDNRHEQYWNYPNHTFFNVSVGTESYGSKWSTINGWNWTSGSHIYANVTQVVCYEGKYVYYLAYEQIGYNDSNWKKYIKCKDKKNEVQVPKQSLCRDIFQIVEAYAVGFRNGKRS